jgi:hypothetical protein
MKAQPCGTETYIIEAHLQPLILLIQLEKLDARSAITLYILIAFGGTDATLIPLPRTGSVRAIRTKRKSLK